MAVDPFPLGKLPNSVLAELLDQIATKDPRVVVGPGVGLDAAVIDIGDRYLVAKTDPITFATDLLGWYAVHVNANDVACTGATPKWFLATLLLPEGEADRPLAERIFEQLAQACASLNISLVGGHTEITYGIDRPIVAGCLLGEVDKDRMISAAGAQVADAIVLAGGVPIEAVSILAREKADELENRFEPEFLDRCRDFLYEPGLSVVKAAGAALDNVAVHALHDPTEGGVAAGLWELAGASNYTLEVELAAIPVLPEGKALCGAFGLDPLASIASGALLIATPGDQVEALLGALSQEGIAAADIGRVQDRDAPEVRTTTGKLLPLPERDEIARLFEE